MFAADQLPEGDFGGVVKSLLYYSGNQTAKSTSFVTTRGCMSALEQGRAAHCRRPPYGIDKAYIAPDGTWLHIIRTRPDGTQLKLHPKTREVIGQYGRNEATGSRSHYVKQKEESVVLVPGDAAQVALVNRIFRRILVDGWGPMRIAVELNLEGIPSPWNSVWSPDSIYKIIYNPIFLGVGVANRYSGGIYYVRNPSQPKLAQTDVKMLATRRSVLQKIRPKADWFERNEPHLTEFLDPDLRELVRAFQQKYWERMANGHVPKPHGDRHHDSLFLLKNILRSKQGGYSLKGRVSGSRNEKRYYRITKMLGIQKKGTMYGRSVRAEPLERAVLSVLREVLSSKADLREQLAKAIRQRAKKASSDQANVAELLAERNGIAQKLEFVIDEFGKIARDTASRKVAELESQLSAIDQRIARAREFKGKQGSTDTDVADDILRELDELNAILDSATPSSVRRLLELLISRLEIDLETHDIEMELSLPSWAMENAKAIKNAMGFDAPSAVKTQRQAHREGDVFLARFSCVDQKLCFECRRRAAA